jgi:protein disulfide-isomerase A1
VVIGLAALVAADDKSDVIDLTATNFDDVTKAEPLLLVEFFAPWCGHCKALAPHYEESATALKDKNIKLAKVDCVDQSELCQTHGVTGYPTLKVFKHGAASEYNGPRKADGIISYMIKQSLPAVSPVTAANIEEIKVADKVVVIAYLPTSADAPAPVFSAVAEKLRDSYLFGLTTDAELAKAAKVTPPAVVIYKKFDDGRDDVVFGKDITEEAFQAAIKDSATPVVDEVSGENYSFYADSGLPLAYLFLDPTSSDHAANVDALRPVAKKYKGKINFVWIDALKFAEHAKALNLPETSWPAFVIQEMDSQMKYPMDQAEKYDIKNVDQWAEQYATGKLVPKLKSQAIPEQNEPVTILVTDQWDEIVLDNKKDVFVEFYAPWCGHCKRLKPTWDSLGEKYAAYKDTLTIAKMDATENDIPASAPFRVSGFPTIKFKPAGSTDFVDYDGDRSFESLVEFVAKHAKNPITGKDVPTEETPAASTQESAKETDAPHQEL